jgi:hypothetical protein
MSSEKELIKLRSFWGAILIPTAISYIIWLIIIAHTSLEWDLSCEGANLFIEIFKVPLGALALIFPLVALVASNHRSQQSAKIIAMQNAQNIFANHYTHIEKLEEHCRKLDIYKSTFLKDYNPRILHSVIYPKSKSGDFSLNADFLDKFKEMHLNLYNLAVDITNKLSNTDCIDESHNMFNEFIKKGFKFSFFVHENLHIPLDNLNKLSDLITTIVLISALVQDITEFDGSCSHHFNVQIFHKLYSLAKAKLFKHFDIDLNIYKASNYS